MGGSVLLGGLALMLVFEGLMPLFGPRHWRAVLERVLRLSDGQIRFLGLCSMAVGLLLLWLSGAG